MGPRPTTDPARGRRSEVLTHTVTHTHTHTHVACCVCAHPTPKGDGDRGKDAPSIGRGEWGSGTQNFVSQKWPDTIFLIVDFPLWSLWSRGAGGPGGRGTPLLLWCTAILILPSACVYPPLPVVPGSLHGTCAPHPHRHAQALEVSGPQPFNGFPGAGTTAFADAEHLPWSLP